MSDRELLTECLDVLTHDAAQRTFAGGVRMSQLAIKLRTHLAAPCLEVTVDPRLTPDEAAAISSALAAPEPEPVAWHYRNNGGASVMHWGPSAKLDADMQAAKDYPNAHKVTPLYTAPPAAAPEPKSKTPAWWMDGLTATLMREGVNKHRAREIAQGYWEAYCQIPGQEEVQP